VVKNVYVMPLEASYFVDFQAYQAEIVLITVSFGARNFSSDARLDGDTRHPGGPYSRRALFQACPGTPRSLFAIYVEVPDSLC